MRLLTMKRVAGEMTEEGECDWFVVLECDIERELYEIAMGYLSGDHKEAYSTPDYWRGLGEGVLEGLLSMGLNDHYTNDDIYYYFDTKVDKIPDIGERWELDDITWERAK